MKKGIRLIHIWEWELRNESIWSKLSKWLLNEFNVNKYSIDLQNCRVVQVSKELEQYFYNLYSIKEYQESDICLGLVHNNQLYQIVSFKIINNQWYLINYGTAYNYSIENGYNAILNLFINFYKVKSIYTLCNLCKEDINLYYQLRFQLQEITNPDIIWCNKDMNISINEQKDYIPLYDCGLASFIYVIS